MNYTIETSQALCTKYLNLCSDIQVSLISKYEQDLLIARILTEMECLGIPLLMNHAQRWAKESDGNALLLQTYQYIGNLRDL